MQRLVDVAGNVLDPLREAELAESALGDSTGLVDVERHQAPVPVQLERRALVGAGEAEAGAELEQRPRGQLTHEPRQQAEVTHVERRVWLRRE